MTIQRQYSLPNCRLVLEGWGEDTTTTDTFMEGRPVMTILVNAECHIVGREKPLTGGREFLDNLVASVNQYAQQVLSGVPHHLPSQLSNSLVNLQTVGTLHRLTVRHPKDEAGTDTSLQGDEEQIDLSTVQLFDLVEAIDQMVADAQTLPDMYLDLTPAPKRSVSAQEPVAKRAIPAALGVSSLAVAAIALFYVPTPEFRPTDPEATQSEDVIDGTTADETIPGSAPDDEADAEAESDGAEVDGRSPATSLDDLPSQDDLEELLTSATPIADADQLDELTADLRNQIVEAWDQPPTFDDLLEYRVGVSEEGNILGFKFVNDAALTHVDEVPLLDLTLIPVDEEAIAEEPIGQFKVVFRPNGVVEVSPWYGRPQS